jgi:hypothetical protein
MKERKMATRTTNPTYNGVREEAKFGTEAVMGQVRAAGEVAQTQAEHAIKDYPISTVLAVFGIGIGLGVVIGSSMFPASASPMSSSNWWPAPPTNRGNWFPAMGQSNDWFNGAAASNWGDSLVKNAKSMCGY